MLTTSWASRVCRPAIYGIAGYQPRVLDNLNLGPSLVRGFAPGGIGPRDLSNWTSTKGNSLGGTDYIGGTLEVQFPDLGPAKGYWLARRALH